MVNENDNYMVYENPDMPATKSDVAALINALAEIKTILFDTRQQTCFLQDQVDSLTLENKILAEKLHVFYDQQMNDPNIVEMQHNIKNLVNVNSNINNYMMEFINVLNKTATWNTARNYINENPQELESLFTNSVAIENLQETATISQRLAKKVKLEPLNDTELVANIGDDLTSLQTDLNKIWASYNKQGKSLDNIYTLSRHISTVSKLAEEYFEGINGCPSVLSLDLKFGNLWRKNDRSFYSKRMAIINKIKDICENPGKYDINSEFINKDGTINLSLAIKIVENIRLGNNRGSRSDSHKPSEMSLNGLYVYFKSKRDCKDDYDVLLKFKGLPKKR
ncbi:hypothetical protein QEN19_002815 [Hanseniaspora menglaensis]